MAIGNDGVAGTAPSRQLIFEYYTSYIGTTTQYYHFQIVFYENMPNVVAFHYYQASSGGSSATIGLQNNIFI